LRTLDIWTGLVMYASLKGALEEKILKNGRNFALGVVGRGWTG